MSFQSVRGKSTIQSGMPCPAQVIFEHGERLKVREIADILWDSMM
jgi:hypothetical protein